MIRHKFKDIKMWKLSIGAAAALLIVAGAVAFALLQSQAKLNGSSIQTDSATLLISPNDITYSNAAAGYDFAHVIPGVQASQTEHFFLKNIGAVPLVLKVSAPAAPDNPAGVDLSKVHVILAPYDMAARTPGTPQNFALQSLITTDSGVAAAISHPASLDAGEMEEFDIQVSMDADAVSGTGATLSNLDLMFTGVAFANTN